MSPLRAQHGALHLLPTERHAERARAAGLRAQSVSRFVLDCANWGNARPAPLATSRLATAFAVETAAPELVRGSGTTRSVPSEGGAQSAAPGDPRRNKGQGWALACALDDAIAALRVAGTDARLLRGLRDGRAELLARLLETADGLLAESGLFDARGAGFVAARAIARAPRSSLPERIVIDSCFEWNQADFAWVEALSARVPVLLRIPHCHAGEAERPEAFWDDSVVSRMEERWHSLAIGTPEIELTELACPVPKAIIEAAHDEAECRAVVAEVLQALRAGADPERIGILVPDLDETFVEPLRAHLIEAGVPYSEPRGRPPVASPVVAAALRWMSLLELPMHRDDVIDLLETAVIDPRAWISGPDGVTRRRRALSLAHVLKRVPIGSDPDGTLLGSASLPSDEEESSPQSWMRRSWTALLAQLAADRREDTRRTLAERLRSAFDALGLCEVSPDAFELGAIGTDRLGHATAQAMRSRLSLQDAASGMRALEAGLRAVETSAAALGHSEQTIGVARFRAELEAALGSVAAQPGLRRAGTVQVIRGQDASSQDWDLLVVTRASEGTFGAAAGATSDPLLDDTVLSRLPASQRPQARRTSQAARTLELGVAMSRAQCLVLTRRRSDADGRPDPPVALFAEWAEQHRPQQEPPSAIRSTRTVSERMRICRALATPMSSALSWIDSDVGHRVHIELERQRFFFDPATVSGGHSGWIDTSGSRLRAHLTRVFGGMSQRPIAPTAIERAANCRFAAWAERVLGARTEGEAGEAVEPSQRGNLVHKALKTAMDLASFSNPGLDLDAEVNRVMCAVRESVLRPPVSPLYAAEVDRSLLDVEAVLRWSLENALAYRYHRGEQSFGAVRDEWKALRLAGGRNERETAASSETPGAGTDWAAGIDVYVRGCIDRIDLSPDGTCLRIIDYKTGSAPTSNQIGVLYFQPQLYASIAQRELGPLFVRNVAALYLETGKRPPRQVPRERLQSLTPEAVRAAERTAADVVHRVWAGDVPPRPQDPRACLRCSSRVICRKPATAPDFDPSSDEGDAS